MVTLSVIGLLLQPVAQDLYWTVQCTIFSSTEVTATTLCIFDSLSNCAHKPANKA